MQSPSPASSRDAATPTSDADTAGSPTFESLGVPAAVAAGLNARGITSPFPIQAATLPPALAGRDVCGRAPTGSGKTIAFGIPLVLRVGRARPGAPRALVLAPTRELAAQIADELVQLADPDQHVATFYGGVGFGKQLRSLREGVDIAVACPGRLEDLISQGHIRLDDVDLVVLDEADRMADMGFLPAVKRLLDACAPKRQTLLFSATLDGDVEVIIRRYLKDPVRHEEAGADPQGDAAEHLFWEVDRLDRVDVTARAAARSGPTVVFCRTKRGADRVAKQLGTRGVPAVAIDGDRSQIQRERALEDFRSGRARAIVATDVAARGIHVDGVTCVVHFDPSEDPKDYVHRSGRTGRAGAAGVVISLVQPDQRRDLTRQQRGLGRQIQISAPDAASLLEGPAHVPGPARRAPSSGGGSTGQGGAPGGRGGQGRGKGGPGGGARRRSRSSSRNGSGNNNGNSGGARNGGGSKGGARKGSGAARTSSGAAARAAR